MNIFEDSNGFKIRTTGAMFYNSDTLFVEYSDIIRNIDFMVLIMISRMKENFQSFLNLDPIYGLNPESLMEWYMNRKNKNILYELLKTEKHSQIFPQDLDKKLNELTSLLGNDGWIDLCPELKFSNVLKLISKEDKNFLAHIRVWHPYRNEVIESDVKRLFNERVQFIYGPLEEVLKNIANNSTFVFSDITNIMLLEEIEKLEFSSILIPSGYKYNEVDGKIKLNIESYEKDHIFKFNFFDNF